MKLKKIMLVIAVVSFIGTISLASTTTKKNKILLEHRTYAYGCIINQDNKLFIESNNTIRSYVSVGEMVKIEKEVGNKTFVEVEETGAKGFINSTDIYKINSAINKKLKPLDTTGVIINVSSKVNLRKVPSMKSKILLKLDNSIPIQVIGKQGEWYKVRINNVEGFIFSEYIGVKNTNTKNSASLAIPKVSSSIKTNIDTNKNYSHNQIVKNNVPTKNNLSNTSKVDKKNMKKSNIITNIATKKVEPTKPKNTNIKKNENKLNNLVPLAKTNIKEINSTDSKVNIKKIINKTHNVDNKIPYKKIKSSNNLKHDTNKISNNSKKKIKSNKVIYTSLPKGPLLEFNTQWNNPYNEMSTLLNPYELPKNNSGYGYAPTVCLNIYTQENPASYGLYEPNSWEPNRTLVLAQFANSKKVLHGYTHWLHNLDSANVNRYRSYYAKLYYGNTFVGTLYFGNNIYYQGATMQFTPSPAGIYGEYVPANNLAQAQYLNIFPGYNSKLL